MKSTGKQLLLKRIIFLVGGLFCVGLAGPVSWLPKILDDVIGYFSFGYPTRKTAVLGWLVLFTGLALTATAFGLGTGRNSQSPSRTRRVVSALRFFPLVCLAALVLVASFFLVLAVRGVREREVVSVEVRGATLSEGPVVTASGVWTDRAPQPWTGHFDYQASLDFMLGLPIQSLQDRQKQRTMTSSGLASTFPLSEPRLTFAPWNSRWATFSAEISRGQRKVRIVVERRWCYVWRDHVCDGSEVIAHRRNVTPCDGELQTGVRCYMRTAAIPEEMSHFKVIFDFADL